jgi:CRISPR-associated protein Cmr2
MAHEGERDVTAMYARKIIAFLQTTPGHPLDDMSLTDGLADLVPELAQHKDWWLTHGALVSNIAGDSSRSSLGDRLSVTETQTVRHPLSGEEKRLTAKLQPVPEQIKILRKAWACLVETGQRADDRQHLLKAFFWWCWRFYPQALAQDPDDLLYPAYPRLPDSTWHSHASTVSALATGLSGDDAPPKNTPYLVLFTFSPIQEFIKASRKFLDFWSGSYLLHYLSARLCWSVSQDYGPDTVITPSLWEQPIFDALMLQEFTHFRDFFGSDLDPISRFDQAETTALCTAGFPNTIIVLVPGEQAAIDLGKRLKDNLNEIWSHIAQQVREAIEGRFLVAPDLNTLWDRISMEFPNPTHSPNIYYRELRHYNHWEWKSLWDSQIDNTWETYFSAIPLGHPEESSEVDNTEPNLDWIHAQNKLIPRQQAIPTDLEKIVFERLNVGTWWGSLQGRLGRAIQEAKNTRNWQVPTAPGERSSISGYLSVLHPRFNYEKFPEGRGIRESSNRLFWRAMAEVFPGLFNGAEKLNAVEVTKRMAWQYGGVAESLGIFINSDDYESLIRFPNLSSIAAARFAEQYPDRLRAYWSSLRRAIADHPHLQEVHDRFCSITRRPFQIRQADRAIAKISQNGNGYNGVMFSSRWLVDDLGLTGESANAMRQVVSQTLSAHAFGDSSPADWWALVLADGDSMGKYVSGHKLKVYGDYLVETSSPEGMDDKVWESFLTETYKRMGPSTHIGFNRALLDFSNGLVPHLAEHRCCGRVIYSGGDDVMVALPLADLPRFLRSQRAAWCGAPDPEQQFQNEGGYWLPTAAMTDLPRRPLFTMGGGATMSLGVVIAHQRVPLPTVLENLWSAEKDRAKALLGELRTQDTDKEASPIPEKDGICFRVIYGSGNVSEALMKGHLLEPWWTALADWRVVNLEPVLLRLADDIATHGVVTASDQLMAKIAQMVFNRRDQDIPEATQKALITWLNDWEDWAWKAQQTAAVQQRDGLGASPDDLANLLRFSAFWVTRQRQTFSSEVGGDLT